MSIEMLMVLLILFQVKHFLADFPFQSEYMLGKQAESGWRTPLLWHSGYHAIGTLVIAIFFVGIPFAMLLAITDFALHFIIDRAKAIYNNHTKVTPEDPNFWNAIGLDQMFHQFTMLYIVYLIY